jgi:hypothetical protein
MIYLYISIRNARLKNYFVPYILSLACEVAAHGCSLEALILTTSPIRASLFFSPPLELNLNLIAHYSNLHLPALFSFPMRVTGLFWLATSGHAPIPLPWIGDTLYHCSLVL